MNPYLQPIGLGQALPLNNPHAVSVNLPGLADVIGYEEKDPEILGKMTSGYPRFFTNKLVGKLIEYVREKNDVDDTLDVFPLMEQKAFDLLQARFDIKADIVTEYGCVFYFIKKKHPSYQAIKDYIRYAGFFLSSRKAEDALLSLGLIDKVHQEKITADGDEFIRKELARAYATNGKNDVILTSCGMNAIFAVFEAIRQVNPDKSKQNILQVGCLYVDSDQMIRDNSKKRFLVPQASDLDGIKNMLEKEHQSIRAVFTEVPSNPIIDCVDVPALYTLCQQFNIPLILDTTFGTPHNINILPYCDFAVESLTKFACGHGDTIMGAVIINDKSTIAKNLSSSISLYSIQPYHRDSNRLAIGIADYQQRMETVSSNTRKLIAYLQNSPAVKSIFSVINGGSGRNFNKIRKDSNALPGLISIVFNDALSSYYDKINLPKGPSLGTNFTLLMPYVYMAHYDALQTPHGRAMLNKMGLHPELLRISVGLEPVEEIIEVFQKAGI